MIRITVSALAAFCLAACGGEPERAGTETETEAPAFEYQAEADEARYPAEAYVFRCGETEMAVVFEGVERLTLYMPDEQYTLVNVVAETGARFVSPGDETTSFWMNDDEAQLSVAGEDYPDCELEREPI